jgi:hypothetical protein
MNLDDLALVEEQARREYAREVRLAQRAARLADWVGAGRAGNRLATALADACLAAPGWDLAALTGTAAGVFDPPPRWLGGVLAEVLADYPRPPRDRPRSPQWIYLRFVAFAIANTAATTTRTTTTKQHRTRTCHGLTAPMARS